MVVCSHSFQPWDNFSPRPAAAVPLTPRRWPAEAHLLVETVALLNLPKPLPSAWLAAATGTLPRLHRLVRPSNGEAPEGCEAGALRR
jgi:hypothetical protein